MEFYLIVGFPYVNYLFTYLERLFLTVLSSFPTNTLPNSPFGTFRLDFVEKWRHHRVWGTHMKMTIMELISDRNISDIWGKSVVLTLLRLKYRFVPSSLMLESFVEWN